MVRRESSTSQSPTALTTVTHNELGWPTSSLYNFDSAVTMPESTAGYLLQVFYNGSTVRNIHCIFHVFVPSDIGLWASSLSWWGTKPHRDGFVLHVYVLAPGGVILWVQGGLLEQLGCIVCVSRPQAFLSVAYVRTSLCAIKVLLVIVPHTGPYSKSKHAINNR